MDRKVAMLYVAYFGSSRQTGGPIGPFDEIPMIRIVEATPVEYSIRECEPLPRPTGKPARIKQAYKQPLRKTMRSVNRNR